MEEGEETREVGELDKEQEQVDKKQDEVDIKEGDLEDGEVDKGTEEDQEVILITLSLHIVINYANSYNI